MIILGISSFYHDSAAVLIKNGKVVWAAEEERFTRIKHDNSFPKNAIDFCLRAQKITGNQLDAIAYYEKPLLKFERILETFVQTYPKSLFPFVKTIPEWLGQKINVESMIRKTTGFKGKIYYVPHHLSHASASYYPSSFEKSAIATIDGVGEYTTTALWHGDKTTITLLKEINFPHSLGLLYSTFTAFLGFRVNNDEYKMMGLAAYGKPVYQNKVKKLIVLKNDGSFELNMKYFSFREAFRMWSNEFENLFDKPRKSDETITNRHKDIASSIQKVTEEVYFSILNHLYQITKTPNLCIAGGVGLNSLANGQIYRNTPFKNVSILGPAGDSGGAIGSALYAYHAIYKNRRRISMHHLYLGSSCNTERLTFLIRHSERSEAAIKTTNHIDSSSPLSGTQNDNIVARKFTDESELLQTVVQLLSENKVIGWVQGRMEFGPRALGHRSILANPKEKWMKDRVNEIKNREQFRPFAVSILQEHIHEVFDVPEKNHYSPFMNFCFEVKKEWRKKIAAVVHADNTCRVQTVNEKDNGIYYRLIKEFYNQTGIPCLLNTSFNLSHEPIVEKVEQALDDFKVTNLDYLVFDNSLITC
jgi:carbamoyltransferase